MDVRSIHTDAAPPDVVVRMMTDPAVLTPSEPQADRRQ
jgi:hypothetical protein